MGDRYTLQLECPYCKKKEDVFYAHDWAIEHTCEYCNKRSKIVMSFKLEKEGETK